LRVLKSNGDISEFLSRETVATLSGWHKTQHIGGHRHHLCCNVNQWCACTLKQININKIHCKKKQQKISGNNTRHWQTLISFSDGIRVSNARAVIPNIATIGNARMKYGEFAQLQQSCNKSQVLLFVYWKNYQEGKGYY